MAERKHDPTAWLMKAEDVKDIPVTPRQFRKFWKKKTVSRLLWNCHSYILEPKIANLQISSGNLRWCSTG